MGTKTRSKKSIKHSQSAISKRQTQKPALKFNSSWFYLIGVVAICLLALIIRINFLGIPFERDEGAYSYYGQLVIDGKTPYISFYETKPPGLFYIYAFAELIAGSTVESLHAAGIVVNLITIVFIYLLATRLLDRSAGLIAAASFALLSLSKGISGFSVQAEHFVILFFVSGLWLLLKAFENNKWHSYLGAGALICMSFMIKQNGLFIILFAGLLILINFLLPRSRSVKKLLINGSIFSIGALVLIGSFVLVIFMQHAMADMWKWVYEMPRNYTSRLTTKQGMEFFDRNFGRFFSDYPVLIVLALLGFVLTFISRLPLLKKLFIILFLVFSFLAICPGLWFYNHYFILLTPAFAICIASFFYTSKQLLAKITRPAVASGVATAAFLIIIMLNLKSNSEYFFNPDHTQIMIDVYGINPFPEAREIGSVLKDRTTKGDIIGVLGAEPELFIYTGRRGPSAHDMAILLYGGSGIKTTEWQKKWIADVERTKPKYFVYFNNPVSLSLPVTDTSIFSWFRQYVPANYKLEGLADMDQVPTKYVWDSQVTNYKITGKNFISVFRRKDL